MKIAVVGAGPGGMAAAVTAAEQGAEVLLFDDNPNPGGQIWRQGPEKKIPPLAAHWMDRLLKTKIESHFGWTAQGHRENALLASHDMEGLRAFNCDKIILATGARELFLPFPGWTLPGVLGCGGGQAFLKTGMPVKGLNVVVAGSGPLLLAVAALFRQKGAHVIGILEQAPLPQILTFLPELLRHPAKLWQGIGYGMQNFPVRPRFGTWIKRAEGSTALQSVIATDGSREWKWDCDLLACGFGLVPNLELPMALGCDIEGGRVRTDAVQKTSVENIYCAGEGTGIGGEDVALLEGEIAALSALGISATAKILERQTWDSFVVNLDKAFALRPELKSLAADDTVVCRCEDVPFGALKNFEDQRTAKLVTRCGMGPCQGRICGPTCQVLFGWEANKARWPLSPIKVSAVTE